MTDASRGPRRRATLADVAAAAGVSTAAVSYALNGQPGVSPANREMILKVARQLNFRPNRIARALRHGDTRVIGLLLGDIANPFYPELAGSVVEQASLMGFQVFVSATGIEGTNMRQSVEALLDHQCDGFIFTASVDEDKQVLEDISRSGTPLVQVIRRVSGLQTDFVGVDDFEAGRAIAGHVLGCGHRNVAILGGVSESSASSDRLRGYLTALEGNANVIRSDLQAGFLTLQSGLERARAVLRERTINSVDAFICGNDMIALGALDAIEEAGLSAPRDIAVVGYDDMSFAASRLIGLTTIEVPRGEIGKIAVRMLVDRTKDVNLIPRHVIVPYTLKVRGSCC